MSQKTASFETTGSDAGAEQIPLAIRPHSHVGLLSRREREQDPSISRWDTFV